MAEGLSPDTEDDTAPEIAGFEVLRPLGAGGMGKVYLARQISLDRLVAIKVLPMAEGFATQFLDRLEREAMAMAKISHPNIVGVYDFIRLKNAGAAIIMEWIDGGNLREILLPEKKPVKDLNRIVAVIRQVADSLAAAHRVGIVHRDVKPENILISQDGVVKVSDFGLALPLDEEAHRITVSGTSLGTLGYMAPEQMDGSPVDARADIYSLGVIFYEMLTGVRPQGNFDPPKSLRPGLPPQLNDLTLLTLRTNPLQRIQSAEDLAAALSRKRQSGRRASLAIVTATGIVAAVAGAYYYFPQLEGFNREPETETETETETAAAAPAAAPAPAPATQNPELPSNSEGFSDFSTHPLKGNWYPENNRFRSGSEICILELDTELPTDGFRLTVDFTRLGGQYSIAIFMGFHQQGMASVELSAWEAKLGGFQMLRDDDNKLRDLRSIPESFQFPLENDRRYQLEVVHQNGVVTTSIDGKEYQRIDISDRRLRVTAPWEWYDLENDGEGIALAIGSYHSPTVFHSVQLSALKDD